MDPGDRSKGLFDPRRSLAVPGGEMDVHRRVDAGPVDTGRVHDLAAARATGTGVTDAEAIGLGNDTPYGLASYFWTRDYSRAWRVSEQLEAGMIGLNDVAISGDSTPFGGIKESGVGREGSRYGLDDYLEIKYVAMGGI